MTVRRTYGQYVLLTESNRLTALKTLTLRLRGSKTELEEMGEDVSDMATTTSQLQAKLLALTGGKVDIMLDANTFKNSTQILREMAAAWQDMSDIQRANALELMGGKRQANVLSALIQNFDTVEKVIETSANSAGSALKENERYLDSIQGKIDQFTNATQAMWSNFLDADWVKGIVAIGTWIIRLIDKIGILKTSLVALSAISMIKNKMGPITFLQGISNIITGTVGKIRGFITSLFGATTATSAYTAETLAASVANGTLSASEAASIASKNGLALASIKLTAAETAELLMKAGVTKAEALEMASKLGLTKSTKTLTLAKIQDAVASGKITAKQGAQIASALGLSVANKGLAASFGALWTAMWPILALMAGIAAIYGIFKLFDYLTVSAKEASEQLEETKNNISSLESELESLQTELDETKEKIAELVALPTLSLTQQEDLERLEREVELLERQIALKERQLAIEEAQLVEDSEVALKKNWGKTDKNKKDKKKLNKYIAEYEETSAELRAKEDAYLKASQEIVENQGMSYETWRQVRKAQGFDDNVITEDAYKSYGFDNLDKQKSLLSALDNDIKTTESDLTNLASSIEEIFNDPTYAGLTYGMSDEIDAFLDDYNNAQLKWEKALYGNNSTVSIIESLWGPNASDEMKAMKSEIDKIMAEDGDWASDDEKWQSKNDAIKKYIDGIDATADGYHQLNYVLGELGKTSQDIANYFTVLNGEFNSKTIEGVTKQYARASDVINQFKGGLSVAGIDSNGNESLMNFDDLFKFDNKTKKWEADAEKVSQILKGADEETRKQFAAYISHIKNAKQEAEAAGKEFDITAAFTQASKNIEIDGLLRVIDITKESLSSLNQVTFDGIADEINGLIDTFDEFSKALADTASAMDTLYEAQDQMNSSGRVSVKTALELMQSTEDWNSVLKINGDTIELQGGAENALIQSRLDLIEQNINAALSEAELQYAKLEGADATLLQGDADLTTAQAQKEFDKAMNQSTAVSAGLGAAAGNLIEKLRALATLDFDSDAWNTSITNAFTSAYDSAITVLDGQSNPETEEELRQRITDLRAQRDMIGQLKKNPSAFRDYYDFDTDPGDKYGEGADDAFQREMDYWENRIAANQAKYEQLQNEIDLLEAKGQKADASLFEEQIKLENEHKRLLEQQKQEALLRLQAIEAAGNEGSESWWDVANTLNDIEGELDDVTSSILDLQDAIGEIDTYKFEEFNTRLGNLVSKLDTIRNLIAPDGEEDWFDDEGNWTEAGVAVLGSQLQQLEIYKKGYQDTVDELSKYKSPYAGNESYYESLGIHSEQEYYDKTEELISQQYDYAESISDTEQSVVDMYESNIDAVEEYTETLIDSYNDYIDSVKEALDAERDLYDFKKNVQKQAKDMAALERRIASLSGSTNAADIAERRKLEAQLYESRESLNDTYYDHAKDAQNEALDAEASAYEETMTKMVEGMRTSLEQATEDMTVFLDNVTTIVSLNAGTILTEYQNTGLELDPALTTPWVNAKNAVGDYSGDALALMNTWAENGFLTTFSATVEDSLKSPWVAGSNAANSFENSVNDVMENVVDAIATNVQTASTELSALYQQILDTEKRAASSNITVSNDNSSSSNNKGGYTQKQYHTTATLKVGSYTLTSTKSGTTKNEAETAARQDIAKQYEQMHDKRGVSEEQYTKLWNKTYKDKIAYSTSYYAKGTAGTSKDQLAIVDELGPELILHANPTTGRLEYLTKGSGVVTADATAELMKLADIGVDGLMMPKFDSGINMMANYITKPEFKIDIEEFVHVDKVDQDTLPKLEAMMDRKINDFGKALNYSIKRFAR